MGNSGYLQGGEPREAEWKGGTPCLSLVLNHVRAFSLQCCFYNESEQGDDNEVIEKRALPHWRVSEGLCLV